MFLGTVWITDISAKAHPSGGAGSLLSDELEDHVYPCLSALLHVSLQSLQYLSNNFDFTHEACPEKAEKRATRMSFNRVVEALSITAYCTSGSDMPLIALHT